MSHFSMCSRVHMLFSVLNLALAWALCDIFVNLSIMYRAWVQVKNKPLVMLRSNSFQPNSIERLRVCGVTFEFDVS